MVFKLVYTLPNVSLGSLWFQVIVNFHRSFQPFFVSDILTNHKKTYNHKVIFWGKSIANLAVYVLLFED